jgi:AcrR family transcriptional regulator
LEVPVPNPDDVPRRVPRQERGERRVAELLEAAEAVIAEIGYEAATMSAIAERAGAAIGSLYQFFPNKPCVTQALRAEYTKRFDRMCAPLAARATTLNPRTLAGHLIDLAVDFAETHRALPALLDAPGSTRAPSAIRRILRERFAGLVLAQNSKLSKPEALRMGMVTLEMIRALSRLYMEVLPRERPALVREFKTALASYLKARSNGCAPRRTEVRRRLKPAPLEALGAGT